MKVIKYLIKMKNGGYMKQDFNDSLEKVKIRTVDLPIDADLLPDRDDAKRILNQILTGDTNLLVLFDDDNPPLKVVECKIDLELQP